MSVSTSSQVRVTEALETVSAVRPVGASGTLSGGATSTTWPASGVSRVAVSSATRRAIWMAPYSWKWVSSVVPSGRFG
ncbi:hypothetical protein GCM10029992_03110 [Glycomyces albus]